MLLRPANPCATPEARLTQGLQTVIDPDPPGNGNSHEIHAEDGADDCMPNLVDGIRLQDARGDVGHEGQMKDNIALVIGPRRRLADLRALRVIFSISAPDRPEVAAAKS